MKVMKIIKPFLAYEYPSSSWEFATKSLFWDIYYQRRIFFLTFALSLGEEFKKHMLLVTYFDIVHDASEEL